MIAIGEVVSLIDKNDGDRIRVRVRPTDNIISDDNFIPYAYPLLPKTFHVKPKLNETVLVFFANDNNKNAQRYYIGPLISQPQFIEKQLYGDGATNLLQGSIFKPASSQKNEARGALPKDSDVAILGRKNSDIILSENDLMIRCGVKQINNEKITFNTTNPAFLKLNYFPNKLFYKDNNGITKEIYSAATLFADKINLISNNGDPFISINDDKSISDKALIDIINKAHQLPYGDILCELIIDFIKLFKNHTHNYNNLPIVEDPNYVMFRKKYGENGSKIKELILSKSIRIN